MEKATDQDYSPTRFEGPLAMTKPEKREQLKTLYDRLAELNRALQNCGKSKRGTRWETDRIQQREFVRKSIERLEDVPPVPSYNPGNDPLYEGLEDDQAAPELPRRQARGRRFEPTPEDEAARLAMLAARTL